MMAAIILWTKELDSRFVPSLDRIRKIEEFWKCSNVRLVSTCVISACLSQLAIFPARYLSNAMLSVDLPKVNVLQLAESCSLPGH
jgi:hypothetical protein